MDRSLSPLPIAFAILASCAAVPQDTGMTAEGDSSPRRGAGLIDPVSAGTTFESPRIETSLEAHVVHQEFPASSVLGDGNFNLFALQARLALNDRWSLIATKDGYIDLNPSTLPDDEGMADIAGGVKYLAYDNPETGLLVTPGLIFETSTGDEEVFQGNGDGVVRPFVTAGLDRGRVNWMGAVGYNLPLDGDAESTSFDYHLHFSYELTPEWIPLVELNGITYTDNGTAFPGNFEGGDLINLGSTNVEGNTFISGALGMAYRPNDDVQVGLTYEAPWSSRDDLMQSRVWFAVLFRF